jgi:hypothetical protein
VSDIRIMERCGSNLLNRAFSIRFQHLDDATSNRLTISETQQLNGVRRYVKVTVIEIHIKSGRSDRGSFKSVGRSLVIPSSNGSQSNRRSVGGNLCQWGTASMDYLTIGERRAHFLCSKSLP